MNSLLTGGFGIIIVLFLFALAILWFLLPFAIFGTKEKLDFLIAETKRTNAYLAHLSKENFDALILETKKTNAYLAHLSKELAKIKK